jgi:hypothetical protein
MWAWLKIYENIINYFETFVWKTVICLIIDTRTLSIFNSTVSITSYKNRKKQEEWILQGIKQANDKDGRIERKVRRQKIS